MNLRIGDCARASRPGFPLARAAGTYALARGFPAARNAQSLSATSCAPAAGTECAARRAAACERARKFRRRERAGLPGATRARLCLLVNGGAT